MNKSKATFAAVVIAAMAAAITVGLFKLYMPGFYCVAGVLAAYGLLRGAGDFRAWLSAAPATGAADGLTPPLISAHQIERARIETIKREMAEADTGDSAPADLAAIIEEIKAGGAEE